MRVFHFVFLSGILAVVDGAYLDNEYTCGWAGDPVSGGFVGGLAGGSRDDRLLFSHCHAGRDFRKFDSYSVDLIGYCPGIRVLVGRNVFPGGRLCVRYLHQIPAIFDHVVCGPVYAFTRGLFYG